MRSVGHGSQPVTHCLLCTSLSLGVQMEADHRRIECRFRDGILEVQQKAGYKNQLLEKKLELLRNDMEVKETQLGEVLSSANLDPVSVETVTRRMEVNSELPHVLQPQAPTAWGDGAIASVVKNVWAGCRLHRPDLRPHI